MCKNLFTCSTCSANAEKAYIYRPFRDSAKNANLFGTCSEPVRKAGLMLRNATKRGEIAEKEGTCKNPVYLVTWSANAKKACIYGTFRDSPKNADLVGNLFSRMPAGLRLRVNKVKRGKRYVSGDSPLPW